MANDVGQAILDEVKRLGARFDRMESRMSAIEDVVADLDGRIKSFPDMHYLAAAAKAQLAQMREMKADAADFKVKIDEIYQSMATAPEIQNLREQVSRFRERSLDVDVRLGTIEGHLGIEGNPQPR